MKKWMLVAIAGLVSASAMAQLAGLPYGDGAEPAGAGAVGIGGSATFGDDFNLYGGRLSLGLADAVDVFADVGIVDPDISGADNELAYQAGLKLALPLDLPVDVALRGAVGYTSFDAREEGVKADVDVLTVNAGVVVSKKVEALTLYGFAGANYNRTKIKVSGIGSETDDETELALAAGAKFQLADNLAVFGEYAHIDDSFISVGLTLGF
jgi:opacity protein-like surface antigen